MNPIIFDGKALARKIEDELYHKVQKLGTRPVMATIIVGEDEASKIYVNLKKQAAERIGAQMDVYEYPMDITKDDLIARINHLNSDPTINGIMIQLPLPKKLKEDTELFINHISPEKDVDGMREDSPYTPATVKAVFTILEQAAKKISLAPDSYIVVVGAGGAVGRKLVHELSRADYEVGGLTEETDEDTFTKELLSARVIISATGIPDLIKAEHVSPGAVVIDVGAPHGDVDYSEVKNKAGFITPVPGGVGPMTVASLMQNLVKATQ